MIYDQDIDIVKLLVNVIKFCMIIPVKPLTYTGTHRCIQVHTSTHRCIQVYKGVVWGDY